MRRTWIGLGALLAVVAALAAWVHLKPQRSDATLAYALSATEPAAVRTIRYEPGAEEPLVLERTDQGWRISAPFAGRADRFQVERLLAILQARASARYPAAELARFGLDQPAASLMLGDEHFVFGSINAMTREQYVLTREGVHAVPIVFTRLPRSAETLIARELFTPAEIPVRFDLPDFSMVLEEGRWRLSADAGEASPDERTAWAERWRHAAALHAGRFGGGTPEGSIAVALADGRRVVLGILRHGPELVLVRADEGIQYHFSAEAARRLLEPPGARAKISSGVR
jgi:hypothetical protein